MTDCIFCQIAKRDIPAKVVWEDEDHLAFLDVKPISFGHILLIPKKHVDYIFDLDEDEYRALFWVAKKLAKPLKETTKAKKIGIMVEGFGVPHTHVHLIPINRINDVDPNRAKKICEKELAKTAKILLEALNR